LKYFKLFPNTTVGFVGDGYNDIQAIKAADTSLKLGFADLSKSTSFVSQKSDIGDMLFLIQEAKAALKNGFHNFSIIMIISFFQLFIKFICFRGGRMMNEIQLITIDFIIVAFIATNIPAIKPATKISSANPKNSLYNKEIMINLFGNIFLIGFLSIFGYYNIMKASDYYQTPAEISNHTGHLNLNFDGGNKFFDTHYIFFFHLVIVLIFGAVDNVNDKFRQSFFSSRIIKFKYAFLAIFTIIIGMLPYVDNRKNPLFYILVYIFRIRLVFSQYDSDSVFMHSFGIAIIYTFGCIFIKTISILSVKNESKEYAAEYKQKLIDKITY
jgi:magnesium-transporting ATPase (P-type)